MAIFSFMASSSCSLISRNILRSAFLFLTHEYNVRSFSTYLFCILSCKTLMLMENRLPASSIISQLVIIYMLLFFLSSSLLNFVFCLRGSVSFIPPPQKWSNSVNLNKLSSISKNLLVVGIRFVSP